MPRFLLFLLLTLLPHLALVSQTTLISWNIRDLGRTKSDTEIRQMAEIVREADLVAIQEVVAGYGGAQAVARLADELNRMGAKWDYRISDPTASPPYKTERYAFLWKTSRVQLVGRPWLERSLAETVYREPYMGRFRIDGRTVLVCNYHARRYDENPEEEIVLLASLPGLYPGDILLIAGDFNASEDAAAFNDLYAQGYRPALREQKTTLKHKCNDGYRNHPIDNIYFPFGKIQLEKARAIDFVGACENLENARALSDHLPVELVFNLEN
jgi:endonuclease/exonuclease/phosphatase family metal-dependent hydrolase